MIARLRVVVADDHVPTRAGVSRALEADGFDVVAQVASAPAAVAAAHEHRPHVCLLDIDMPGDGIEAARAIRAQLPEIAVVMLTVQDDDDHLFGALRAGASGYLLKDTSPERLPDALRGVLAGEAAIPRTLVARLVEQFREAGAGAPEEQPSPELDLSERERDVLERLRSGASTKQIAFDLGLSDVTVRRHISGLVTKLGVEDRHAAIRHLEDLENGH